MNVLRMDNPHVIFENPSKPNVAYSVYYTPKDRSLEDHFQWLGDELITQGRNSHNYILLDNQAMWLNLFNPQSNARWQDLPR